MIGSVKFVMLLMRFLQLFLADYANALFESVRVMGENGERKPDRTQH
ncbi:MAG: hypothetical protein QM724_07985 [Flavobacteriales bacterium]